MLSRPTFLGTKHLKLEKTVEVVSPVEKGDLTAAPCIFLTQFFLQKVLKKHAGCALRSARNILHVDRFLASDSWGRAWTETGSTT